MDITNILKYNNLTIPIEECVTKNSISGWSLGKLNYKNEKILKRETTKFREYYILNGIKFHKDSILLIKDDFDTIIEFRISELHTKFINNEIVEILDYNLNKIQINEIVYIEKSAFKDRVTFLTLQLSHFQLFVPYSESAILIRGMLTM